VDRLIVGLWQQDPLKTPVHLLRE